MERAAGSYAGAAAPAHHDLKTRRNWLSDFEFSGRSITVKKTGATTRLDGQVLHEVAVWVRFYLIVRVVALFRWLLRRPAPVLRFANAIPRPWYFIHSAAVLGGVRIGGPDDRADAEILFDDATWTTPMMATLDRTLNFACADISKSTVARHFETAFGYPLALDPARHHGEAVEKGEVNSMHDGRVVTCPRVATSGHVYQRLVDTEDNGVIRDLRTSIVGACPVIVCAKERNPRDRFRSIDNIRVALKTPSELFTADEIARIGTFARLIGLDWGTLDILRDRNDGRIYIVDANKTDVGPVLALSLADQLRAARIVGRALRQFMVSPLPS